MKAGLDIFTFEGREMPLKHTFAVFITMNPGYAGRTELPDNLKALFRPMAMMIPDYALVAEVMLFSEGFLDFKDLSRKMTKLYKLSSEQLSQQDHYDFGMRALKSVLVMAGALKRGSPDLDEQVVLIRAMPRMQTYPSFLADDLRAVREPDHGPLPQPCPREFIGVTWSGPLSSQSRARGPAAKGDIRHQGCPAVRDIQRALRRHGRGSHGRSQDDQLPDSQVGDDKASQRRPSQRLVPGN